MEWTLTFGWGPALVHESAAGGRLLSSPAYQPTRAEAGRLSVAIIHVVCRHQRDLSIDLVKQIQYC
jgi:hypothetical protein